MGNKNKEKGIWSLINNNSIKYKSNLTIEDFNDFIHDATMQRSPKEYSIYVGGLSHKFITAYSTNDKKLLAEAEKELKEQLIKEFVRISKSTGLSVEQAEALHKKYHHKYSMYEDEWEISSRYVGDGGDYDDRYEYEYLKWKHGKWTTYTEWTDGWEYKILNEREIDVDEVVEKFLSTHK